MGKPILRHAKLTSKQIDCCFIHMLRYPKLFELGRRYLKVEHFSPIGESHYYFFWMATLEAAERCGGQLPEKVDSILAHEILSYFEQVPKEELPDIARNALDSLYGHVFGINSDQLNFAYGQSLLKELIIERTVVDLLAREAQAARDVGYPVELAKILQDFATQIRSIESKSTEETRTLLEDWPTYENRLQRFRGQEMLGLRTGMPELDRRTLGLRGLTLLGAMPNVGKTALVIQLGLNVVRHNPDACFMLFSLEMGRQDLYARIHCNLAQMDYGTLLRGSGERYGTGVSPFSPEQQEMLGNAGEWIKNNGHRIKIFDRDNFGDDLTADQVLAAIKAFKAEAGASRAFIAIDYLQLIPVPGEVARNGDLEADKYRVRVVQNIVAGTRNEENPLGDAVIGISESRKPASGRNNWGQELADLMGSARLGYAADAVLLYRRMTEDGEQELDQMGATLEELEERGIAPIILRLAKGRDGMRIGQWALEYHFERSTFREIEHRGLERRRNVQVPQEIINRRAGAFPDQNMEFLDN